jgi:hypothetical protein
MSVKFLKRYGSYNEGEIATFTEEREKDLLKRKIAEEFVFPKREGDDMDKKGTGGDGKKNPNDPQNRQTTGTSSKQK